MIEEEEEEEGVIKYQLEYQPSPPNFYPQYTQLNAWRSLFIRLGLIGQDPKRYGGLGFGNISFRPDDSDEFVITGSQTGRLLKLENAHFSNIVSANPKRNYIIANGPIIPSSEALTHASVYHSAPTVKSVVHVHSPDIWRHALTLKLPVTAANIAYGTPAMAKAVADLFVEGRLEQQPIFAMLGHQDGIVSFGNSIAVASQIIINFLSAALKLTPEKNEA